MKRLQQAALEKKGLLEKDLLQKEESEPKLLLWRRREFSQS